MYKYKKRITSLMLFLMAFLIFWATGWLLYRYFRRWSRIKAERDHVVALQRELVEYQRLGFDENSELIAIAIKRLGQHQERKQEIEQQWFWKTPQLTERSHSHLERLFDLNRKMLMGYISDLQEYKKRAVPISDPCIRFSYDKVVRLTIALAELERQLQVNTVDAEFSKRLHRMQEITKQSMMQYKRELSKGSSDREHQHFLHQQLTKRMRELEQLERLS